MHITHLSLTNFRNFGRLELELPPGTTLLYGRNAQGKTNLLESIYYLATTRSPHTNQDAQLINWEAEQAAEPLAVGRIVAHLATQTRARHLEMRLIHEQQGMGASFRREALVDRRKVRLMDLLGNLRVVLFLPQDMELITGSPAYRRRYLDITLCQSDRAYCRTLSQYNKVLEQRNALLRQLAEQGSRRPTDLLNIYTDQLAAHGSVIFSKRAFFLTQLARHVQRVYYEQLTAGRETVRLHYLPRLLPRSRNGSAAAVTPLIEAADWLEAHHDEPAAVSARFRDQLAEITQHDLARGMTTVGPHRDDWRLLVNGRSLNHFGSRGQQRSAVLALKLGEIAWVTDATGDSPILLLDDVMAELDPQRRELLAATLDNHKQAIVTSADPAIFSEKFLMRVHQLEVTAGRVKVQPVS